MVGGNRAALAAIALALTLAPTRPVESADENTVASAMVEFRGSMDASGMRKLKAALAADPPDSECYAALPKGAEDPVIKRLLTRKGETATLAEDLAARADRAHRAQVAVDLALRWLAAHQAEDGHWSAAEFGSVCDGKDREGAATDGPGRPQYDWGVTGLATLAFLHAGFTHKDVHPYGRVVQRALAWIDLQRDEEGCIGPRT